jgi:hypothetical protein
VRTNSLYIAIILITMSCNLFAQDNSDFLFFESRLQTLANKILTTSNDSLKEEANKLLIEDVEELLLMRGSFHYSFENVDKLSIITSPDNKFKLFNWVVPKSNNTFEYYAYLQFYTKRKKEQFYFKLIDISAFVEDEQTKVFTQGDWFGALYSDIVHTKFDKKNFYTFIGWDGNNGSTTKRIIDILTFDENEEPIFGSPIFKMNDGTRTRMVLEYSKKVSTNMSYNEDEEYIVFDHLEPLEGGIRGMYEFYVPSLSYDGLTFKNGKWRLVEDIAIFNSKSQDGRQAKNIERGLQER